MVKNRIKNYDEFHRHQPTEACIIQGEKCMNCGVPYCQSGLKINNRISGCPLNNLIPEFNFLMSKGNIKLAYDRMKLTNNFPEFTSRVCPALCEKACTRGKIGEAVTVKENEYNIIENAYEKGYIKAQPPEIRTGKKIAIIGSGPAGLAAADMLNQRGHSVIVFERSDRIGGLLMYGIPNMKLDKSIINRRVDIMIEEGVKFRTEANIGKDIKGSDLLKEFDRIILACGASQPRDIKVKGREAKGIYFAVDFLKSTTKSLLDNNLQEGSYISAKEKNILIIGGGDTGNDCVATSIRHGANSVIQLEMMPKPKIEKIDYGQEEAIEIYGKDPRVYETTVKEFISDEKGNVTKAVLIKLKNENGVMKEIKNSEYTIDIDLVLIAAGFIGTENYVAKTFGVNLDERNNVATEKNSHKTNVEKVFVAGDMRKGQSLVVWAIREGREVAAEVDRSLMGYTNI